MRAEKERVRETRRMREGAAARRRGAGRDAEREAAMEEAHRSWQYGATSACTSVVGAASTGRESRTASGHVRCARRESL